MMPNRSSQNEWKQFKYSNPVLKTLSPAFPYEAGSYHCFILSHGILVSYFPLLRQDENPPKSPCLCVFGSWMYSQLCFLGTHVGHSQFFLRVFNWMSDQRYEEANCYRVDFSHVLNQLWVTFSCLPKLSGVVGQGWCPMTLWTHIWEGQICERAGSCMA